MPQQKTIYDNIREAWTLNDQVEELRGKIQLEDRDIQAYRNTAESQKKENERLIAGLRKQNKEQRISLAESINFDQKVIKNVFEERRKEKLSMQRFTVEGAIEVTDQITCEEQTRLNDWIYQRRMKEDQLAKLQSKLSKLDALNDNGSAKDNEQTMFMIRHLENKLDKARLKFCMATNIGDRYAEIVRQLKKEQKSFPAKLDSMEEALVEQTREMKELRKKNAEAQKVRQETRKILSTLEHEMVESRRGREQKLVATRKEVEKRKENCERPSKPTRAALITETTDQSLAIAEAKAKRQEKILKYDEMFDKIKRATFASDINDVVARVDYQENQKRQMEIQKTAREIERDNLAVEKENLLKEFTEKKFQGKCDLQEMDDRQRTLQELKERRERIENKLKRRGDVLVNIRAGIAILLEKLNNVKIDETEDIKGDTKKELQGLSAKLAVLVDEVGGSETLRKINSDSSLRASMNAPEFAEYMESKMPSKNIKVKMTVTDDHTDDDEFDFSSQDDNDVLSRDDIKKMGEMMLDSRLKPKKKRTKKKA